MISQFVCDLMANNATTGEALQTKFAFEDFGDDEEDDEDNDEWL